MAKNERITIFLDEKEKNVIMTIKEKQKLSLRELFFVSVLKAYPDYDKIIDENINLDAIKGKEQITKAREYFSHATIHHEIFMKAMELTKIKINPQEIIEKLVLPGIESVKAYDIKDGVHALKELKRWLELDFESFKEYSDTFWHDRVRICDMIKRLEVESYSKTAKYLDNLLKEDENIKEVRKNIGG